MSAPGDIFGSHNRRSTRQTASRQNPGAMLDEEETWQTGQPSQQAEWDESAWQNTGRTGSGTGTGGGAHQNQMHAGGYTQAYPQAGGTQQYGGPATRSQGMRSSRLGEEEGEPGDFSKVYSDETYDRQASQPQSQHEGDYLQGSQQGRQHRSQDMGEQMGQQQKSQQQHHGKYM